MCTIDWHASEKEMHVTPGCITNGSFAFEVKRIPVFTFGRRCLYHSRQTGIVCGIIGYISNLLSLKRRYGILSTDDVVIIEELYRRQGADFIGDLDGIFTLVIWDNTAKRCFIFQDPYGSSLPLYYAQTATGVVLSTRLARVIEAQQSSPVLNMTAVGQLLRQNKIVPNESTLVKGVNKLIRGQYLQVDCQHRTVSVRPTKKSTLILVDKVQAQAHLLGTIGENTTSLRDSLIDTRTHCTLSSGYDSNLILHVLTKHQSDRVTAITIGGRTKNEIPQARECAASYGNVRHLTRIIEPYALKWLEELVRIFEGYVFEAGIFLQYELVRTLMECNATSVFLGDCADQHLRSYQPVSFRYRQRIKSRLLNTYAGRAYLKSGLRRMLNPRGIPAGSAFEWPRNVSCDFILKKSGILLNSFGIQGIYPFLNRHTESMAVSLGRSMRKKSLYRRLVANELGPQRARHIRKIGGSTDLEYLLVANREYVQQMLSSEVIRQAIGDRRLARIKKHPGKNAETIVRLIYITLFNKLFIEQQDL